MVKKLRTPKYATWLKRKNLKYAIIDNETRWNSVYNMLFRLLELKEFCQTHHNTNTELKLKKSEWDSIKSIVSFIFNKISHANITISNTILLIILVLILIKLIEKRMSNHYMSIVHLLSRYIVYYTIYNL